MNTIRLLQRCSGLDFLCLQNARDGRAYGYVLPNGVITVWRSGGANNYSNEQFALAANPPRDGVEQLTIIERMRDE